MRGLQATFLLGGMLLAGCHFHAYGRSSTATVDVGSNWAYYPADHAYYCRSTGQFYVYHAGCWVPRARVGVDLGDVTVHFGHRRTCPPRRVHRGRRPVHHHVGPHHIIRHPNRHHRRPSRTYHRPRCSPPSGIRVYVR